ncbi:nucleotide disphospho-sugar-binding domain-containing protein [Agromyces lapidis]|uniref:Nucleotide disphospho-sugar-binding domain-containing protein n=1 Tax=Agromyces lapidis TaxID=279574 RepID=A0ABV5SSA4_9MICO|nr:nucleotide disphospho-sugar-binding domain-containing protein [Agromyces lapidis]
MSGSPSHHYLVALADGGGTVPVELGVVRRLVERGHRVTALVDESMAAPSRATGAAVHPWSARPGTEFRDWAIRNPLELAKSMSEHYLSGPAAGHAADTRAAIDAARPDLVVTTFFTLGAMIAAEAHEVPFDVLMPNVYIAPVPGRPPGGAGMRPMRGPLGAMRDRMASAATTRLLDRYTVDPLNAVRARHGLDRIGHVWDQVHRARRELVLTTAEFEFGGDFPPNVRFVGPVLDDPAWAALVQFDPPAGDAPLVLVSLSSTFQNHADCLQRIADALGMLPVRGVITTGPSIPPELIEAPGNAVVVASAPHRVAMRHASLVVTHGGHGTVMKALAAGLPLVVLHHGRDQADNAARVVTRGAGVAVPRRAPADEIAAAIERVLRHERYRAAAVRLGAAINRDVAANTLLDELEQLAPLTTPPRSP